MGTETIEELVAERLGVERRIQRIEKLSNVCAYRVIFRDHNDELIVPWEDLQHAGIPEADLAVYGCG